MFAAVHRVTPALALLALSAVPLLADRGLWALLTGRRDLEVITVTDVSVAGSFLREASPVEPQYYLASSVGYQDLGGYMGGIEQPPSPDVIHLISAELAKQGYLPATNHSPPPTLLLVYCWGTLNAEKFFGPDPSRPPIQLNHGQIVNFLGGRKAGVAEDHFDPLTQTAPGLSLYSYEADRILEVAREDFYVIAVAAYDLAQIGDTQKPRPLWITRIACPSLGFSLGNSLPTMLAVGGQHFGRETTRPVWVNASDKFRPNVTLGELKLVEYLKGEPLPVADGRPPPEEKP